MVLLGSAGRMAAQSRLDSSVSVGALRSIVHTTVGLHSGSAVSVGSAWRKARSSHCVETIDRSRPISPST